MKKLLFLLAVMLIAVGMSVAQTGTDSSGANNGQAAQSSSSSTDQGTAATPSSNADQNAADQNGTAAQGNAADQNAGNAGNLPQTGSELPLLAMLGLGSLGGGLISRFRK